MPVLENLNSGQGEKKKGWPTGGRKLFALGRNEDQPDGDRFTKGGGAEPGTGADFHYEGEGKTTKSQGKVWGAWGNFAGFERGVSGGKKPNPEYQ